LQGGPRSIFSKLRRGPWFTEISLERTGKTQCSPRAHRPAGKSKIRRARRRDGPGKKLGRTGDSSLTDYWRRLDRMRPRRVLAPARLGLTRRSDGTVRRPGDGAVALREEQGACARARRGRGAALPGRAADGGRTADRRRRALARAELDACKGKSGERDDVGLTWARPQGLKREARPGVGAPGRRHGKADCAAGAWRGSTRLPAYTRRTARLRAESPRSILGSTATNSTSPYARRPWGHHADVPTCGYARACTRAR
jgi:hypothetical protein